MNDVTHIKTNFCQLIERLAKGCSQCTFEESDGELQLHCSACQLSITSLSWELYISPRGKVLLSALDKALANATAPPLTWMERCAEMQNDLREMSMYAIKDGSTTVASAALAAHESLSLMSKQLPYYCLDDLPFQEQRLCKEGCHEKRPGETG